MSVLIAGITPHPPLIIPEIGAREISAVGSTVEALEVLSEQIAAVKAETVIMITPHGPMFRNALAILSREDLQGDFRMFQAPDVKLKVKNDTELVQAIAEEARKEKIDVVLLPGDDSRFQGDDLLLDHGITVPLYYLKKAGLTAKCVAITFAMLPYKDLFRFGKAVKKAIDLSGRKVAVVASGDLSHRLTRDAPAGFNPRGREFDQAIVENLRNYNVEKLLEIDKELVSVAGECGLRSFIILFGILSGLKIKTEVLSYEGPFGVGYLVASLKPVSIYTEIARKALESRVKGEDYFPDIEGLSPDLTLPGAAFVSLKKRGALRGCIGTISPLKKTLAEEIAANAVSAGLRDPRFPPVSEDELEELTYSVDVLTEPEKVEDISSLDPQRYGVIVRCGDRSGLLLPALEGVSTVEEQLSIARQKAGILPGERVEVFRFEVKRYPEHTEA